MEPPLLQDANPIADTRDAAAVGTFQRAIAGFLASAMDVKLTRGKRDTALYQLIALYQTESQQFLAIWNGLTEATAADKNGTAERIFNNVLGRVESLNRSVEELMSRSLDQARAWSAAAGRHPIPRVLMLLAVPPRQTGSGIVVQALAREHQKVDGSVALSFADGKPVTASAIDLEDTALIDTIVFGDDEHADTRLLIPTYSADMPFEHSRYMSMSTLERVEFLELYLARLKVLIHEYQPDVIHTNHLYLLNALVQLVAPWIPVVSTTHGTELKMLDEDGGTLHLVAPAARRVDRVISISPDITTAVERVFDVPAESISTIGNGFDPIRFQPRKADRAAVLARYGIFTEFDKVVLYIGRFTAWKGLNHLINAAQDYAADPGRRTLTIIAGGGSKSTMKSHRELIQAKGLQDKVKLLVRRFSRDDVSDLMGIADVIAVPSIMEPFSLLALEGLACGCPVVAVDCGGPKMLVSHELVKRKHSILIEPMRTQKNGVVVECDAPVFVQRLADAIKTVLSVDLLWEDRLRISETVAHQTWHDIYLKVRDVYLEVIRKRIERYSPDLRPATLPEVPSQVGVVEFHPTNKCCLDCSGCTHKALHTPGAVFPFEHLGDIVAMQPEVLYVVGGGEPTMYRSGEHSLTNMILELRRHLPSAEICLGSNAMILMDERAQQAINSLRLSTHGLKASHFSSEPMPSGVQEIWGNIWKYFTGPVPEIWITFLFDRTNVFDALGIAEEVWKRWSVCCGSTPALSGKKLHFKLLYEADDSRPADPFHRSNSDEATARRWVEDVAAIKSSGRPFGEFLKAYSRPSTGRGGLYLPGEITEGSLPSRRSVPANQCPLASCYVLVGADGRAYPCCLQTARLRHPYEDLREGSSESLALARARMSLQALPSCREGCRLQYSVVAGKVREKASFSSEALAPRAGTRAPRSIHLLVFDVGATLYLRPEFLDLQNSISLRMISEDAGVSREEVVALFKNGMLLEQVLGHFGLDIRSHFRRKTPQVNRLYPEANPLLRETFERLARRYHLAVVTNNGRELARRTLQSLGIGCLVEHVIGIDTSACGKPDPLMFRMACNHFAVRPDEAVSIGDRPDLDLETAASIGMKTFLVNGPDEIVDHLEAKLDELGEQPRARDRIAHEELQVAGENASAAPAQEVPESPLARASGQIHNAAVYGAMTTGKWLAHPSRVALVAEGRFQDVMPVNAQLVPTTLCPSNCATCTYGRSKDELRAAYAAGTFDRNQHMMSLESMKLFIDRLAEAGVKGLTITGGGDPLLNPHTLDGVKYARTKGLSVGLFTEAHLVTQDMAEGLAQAGLMFLRISFNAGRATTYKQFYGSSEEMFYTVLQNIEWIVEAKKKFGRRFGVGVGVIITPLNMGELMEIARLIQGIEGRYPGSIAHIWYRPTVRYNRGVQLTNPKTKECLAYVQRHPDLRVHYEAYRQFIYEGRQFPAWVFQKTMQDLRDRIKPTIERETPGLEIFYPKERIEAMANPEKGFSECRACAWQTFVGPDGSVYYCVEHGLDPRMVCGNLKDQTLSQIWQSSRRREIHDFMIREGLATICPPMCMLTEYNRVFEAVAQALEAPEAGLKVAEAIKAESANFMSECGTAMGVRVNFL